MVVALAGVAEIDSMVAIAIPERYVFIFLFIVNLLKLGVFQHNTSIRLPYDSMENSALMHNEFLINDVFVGQFIIMSRMFSQGSVLAENLLLGSIILLL
jgi:hypothetical protein